MQSLSDYIKKKSEITFNLKTNKTLIKKKQNGEITFNLYFQSYYKLLAFCLANMFFASFPLI